MCGCKCSAESLLGIRLESSAGLNSPASAMTADASMYLLKALPNRQSISFTGRLLRCASVDQASVSSL